MKARTRPQAELDAVLQAASDLIRRGKSKRASELMTHTAVLRNAIRKLTRAHK